jgi:hypothetical protein
VVIQNLLNAHTVQGINSELEGRLACTDPGKIASAVSKSTIPGDPEVQKATFGSNTKRVDRLAAHSPSWRAFLDDETLHGVCEGVFADVGDYWLNSAQMIEVGPGSRDGPIHPDAGLWSMLLGVGEKAPEVALNFLIAMTRTTVENGATAVLEGSQRLNMSEVLGNPEHAVWKTSRDDMTYIELEEGDALVVSGRNWHRSSANVTEAEKRRVLSCFVTNCALTPEEAHPFFLDEQVARDLSMRVRKFLGFEAMRPSVGAGFWKR